MALRNRSILRAQRIYLDFIYNRNAEGGFVNDSAQQIYALMRPKQWTPTMRLIGDTTSDPKDFRRTYLRDMYFNYFLTTESVVDRVSTTMFLVTLKNESANWNVPVTGTLTLEANVDWCSQGSQNAVFLNPNRFKVLWTRHFITYPENEDTAGQQELLVPTGNPYALYRRGRVRIKCGYSISAPAGKSWKDLDIDDLAPSKRVYLIMFFNTKDAGATKWRVNFGTKFTCI